MSVLVVVLEEANREEMEGWGTYIADALDEEMEFVRVVEGGGDALRFEGELPTTTISPEAAGGVIAARIAEVKPRLLITDQSVGKRGGRPALARSWLENASCDTLCLRFPTEGGRGGGRVLVPTVGGPNARKALKLALELAAKAEDGRVEPFLVESDIDDFSEDVGRARLDGILARSGVPLDGGRIYPRVELGDDANEAIHRVAEEGEYDLILLGASGAGGLQRSLFGSVPDRLLSSGERVVVGVFRRAFPLGQRLRQAVERWLHLRVPQLDRPARVALSENLETNARWSFDFMVLISLSTALAGLGLMMDSAAVVIGAMLVAPLMTPLLGAGLALVQGNLPLMRSCARSILYGFCAALFIGVLLGFAGGFYGLTHQMEMRGSPDVPDMVVAFLSGLAASYCIARPHLSSALAGVAIAAALVPPIATVGIALSLGELQVARGAALLFGTNVVFIILGAAFSLFAAGVRARKASGIGDVVWAKRALLLLLVAGAVLAIPLGSVLLEKIAGEPSSMDLNVATEVSTERRVRKSIEDELRSSFDARASLRDLELRVVAGGWQLSVLVRAEEGIGTDLDDALYGAASRELEGEVTLRLSIVRYREVTGAERGEAEE